MDPKKAGMSLPVFGISLLVKKSINNTGFIEIKGKIR